MKHLLCSVVLFFVLSFISILFVSCSSENGITSAPESKSTVLEKAVVTPSTSINHSTDTVIILPKSGKMIQISKSYPADKIALLDSYLTNHSVSTSNGVHPNLQNCDLHQESYLEIDNTFQSIPGRSLGIWTNMDPLYLRNNYGFNNLITSFDAAPGYTDSGNHTKYQQDSIMINLGYYATAQGINSYPIYKYYLIDDAYENSNANYVTSTSVILNMRSSATKLLISDYYWPDYNLLCWGQMDNGDEIKTNFLINSNTYIMCDMYNGTDCGSVHTYWDRYASCYGQPSKNLTNFITMRPDCSPDWPVLLSVALSWLNGWGACNPIWIYALDSNVNESVVLSFCNIAWQTNWLLRYERQVTVYYSCTGNCTVCNWPYGNWTVTNTVYGPAQWVLY
jgi:hypothetical protein